MYNFVSKRQYGIKTPYRRKLYIKRKWTNAKAKVLYKKRTWKAARPARYAQHRFARRIGGSRF